MKNVKHYFSTVILIIGLITHNYTITMAKKCALLAALISTQTPATPLPTPPLPLLIDPIESTYSTHPLDNAFSMHQTMNRAFSLRSSIEDWKTGKEEKTLIARPNQIYDFYFERYIKYIIEIKQNHQSFMDENPLFQQNLQQFFEEVCGDKKLMEYVNKSVTCCRTPHCQPDVNCHDISNWPYALISCERLDSRYTRNQTIPLVVPHTINPSYRFNETSSNWPDQHNGLKKQLITSTSILSDTAARVDDPLDNAFHLYQRLQEAFYLRFAAQDFESSENEQSLTQEATNYLAHHNLYTKYMYLFLDKYQKFMQNNPHFQDKITAFNNKICCNRDLLDHIIKNVLCCRNPSCIPDVDCSTITSWPYAIGICNELKEKFPCNTTIDPIVPNPLKPKCRFSNVVPLLVNKHDESLSGERNGLTV